MRRPTVVLISLISAAVLSGCAESRPANTPPVATSDAPLAALPADQVVFSYDDGVGGPTAYPDYVANATDFAIYGDGRVFRVAEYGVSYEMATIDPLAVAEFAAQVDKSGLIDDAVDYGDPKITDGSSTRVTFEAGEGSRSISVYLLRMDDVNVSGPQQDNRDDLVDLLEEADQLAEGAAPVPTERLQIVQFDPWNDSGPQWPGPDLATFLTPADDNKFAISCGVVAGPGTAAITDLMSQTAAPHQFDYHWIYAGTVYGLVPRALLPGERECARIN